MGIDGNEKAAVGKSDLSQTCALRPSLAVAKALQLAVTHYPLSADARITHELDSYDDRNYLVQDLQAKYVLKIHNSVDSEAPDFLKAQNIALDYLACCTVPSNRPVAARSGLYMCNVQLPCGNSTGMPPQQHIMRLVTYVEGNLYAHAPQTPVLQRSLGRFMGNVTKVLTGFDEVAFHRLHDWSMSCAAATVRHLLRDLPDYPQERRELMLQAADDLDAATLPPDISTQELPLQICHGDANDMNILVSDDMTQVVGILDVGDMCRTWRVAEVAVALTYQMLLCMDDPFTAGANLLAGYMSEVALTPGELRALPALLRARLALSLCMAARGASSDPDNVAYTGQTAPAAWALLQRLAPMGGEAVLQQLLQGQGGNGE